MRVLYIFGDPGLLCVMPDRVKNSNRKKQMTASFRYAGVSNSVVFHFDSNLKKKGVKSLPWARSTYSEEIVRGKHLVPPFFWQLESKWKPLLRLSYLYLLFLFWINLGQRQNTCEIPWCNKSNLVKHTILEDLKKSDSDIEVLKPYKCSHCDSSFELEKILLQHLAASHLFCWKKKKCFCQNTKISYVVLILAQQICWISFLCFSIIKKLSMIKSTLL